MAATATASLHLFLILSLFASSCCGKHHSTQLFFSNVHNNVVRHDLANQPSPPAPIVTVPATNPNPNPVSPPVTPVTTPASPVTNPVTTPTSPVTNPVTTPASPTPPSTTGGGGQSWCVAKSGLSETALQTALNYACGVGGADCSAIQQNGSCYNPSSLQNHASFAFNSYYQKNPAPTSCDFGGTATVTNQNPSSGSCVYPASTASGTPSIVPTRPPSSGSTATGVGASPPADGSYTSLSSNLQATVGSIALVTFITTTVLISPLRHAYGCKLLH